MHPHLAGNMRQHLMSVGKLHPKHCVRQCLEHRPLHNNCILLCHHPPKISTPSSVIATEYSKCADKLLSAVITVQPSSNTLTFQSPAFTIGSSARTMPVRSLTPVPASPKFGICGSSCSDVPTPCPTKSRTTEKPPA